MDLLSDRTAIIALAVVGGIFSVIARVRQTRGGGPGSHAGWWNALGYIFMAASIVLFIVAGFRKAGS